MSDFIESDDVTLEILMSDMDEKSMVEFTKLKNESSADVIKVLKFIRKKLSYVISPSFRAYKRESKSPKLSLVLYCVD